MKKKDMEDGGLLRGLWVGDVSLLLCLLASYLMFTFIP